MLWYRARLVLSPSTTYLPTPFCVSTAVLIHSVYLYTIYVYTVYMRAHGTMMLVLCFAALLGAAGAPRAVTTPAAMRRPAGYEIPPRDVSDRTQEVCEEIASLGVDVLSELGFGFTAGEIRARVEKIPRTTHWVHLFCGKRTFDRQLWKFFTLRVSPPAHPNTVARRVDPIRNV